MRKTHVMTLCMAGFFAFVISAFAQVTKETPGYFPFWIPALDDTASFTDMSFLSPRPAGAPGRAQIREGHFYDADGNRLRLLGTNLCFQGPFPEKDQAPAVAAHLRKLGFNVIRFHHMDNGSAPRGIWLPDFSGLDPQQVDKLDWLIFNLKQCGIYTNLNLHVSRWYPGMPKEGPREFVYGKAIDNFYAEYIQCQKDYAKALLGHLNPYTQTTYANEPAILVVELNNENALTAAPWEDLRALPEPYLGDLTRQWQAWLLKRYGSTEQLRQEWDEAREPLGDELLQNNTFADGVNKWTLEQHHGARMSTEVVADSGVPSGRALKVATEQVGGVAWSLQFHQVNLDLQDRAPYTLEFWARADAACPLNASVMLDQEPWTNCGLSVPSELDSEWRHFVYTFKCQDSAPGHCRMGFNFNNRVGQFWLADISLRRGGLIGLPEDQRLEDATIPIPPRNAGDAESADFWAFLSETECQYVQDMMRFVREELAVGAFLCDTQANYGGLMGMYRETTYSDYIDMHSYWEHPHFPRKPWDGADWTIRNTSMVTAETGGTLPYLAWFRCFDKPFTVSEYDHPAPNDHAVELFPMLASFAAAQDWDGVYQFDYRSGPCNPDVQRMDHFFELWAHPGKQVFLPIAAVMLRMKAVPTQGETKCLEIPSENLPRHMLLQRKYEAERAKLCPNTLLELAGFRFVSSIEEPRFPALNALPADANAPIQWKRDVPAEAAYTVNVPAVRAAVGFIGGREIKLGDVAIAVTKAEKNWAAVAVGALDGKPLKESSRILIVAAGRIENVNMGWNEDRTSVSDKWGEAPALAEGIEATLRLPVKGKVAALDGTGNPKGDVAAEQTAEGLVFRIGPQYTTLWYAVTP